MKGEKKKKVLEMMMNDEIITDFIQFIELDGKFDIERNDWYAAKFSINDGQLTFDVSLSLIYENIADHKQLFNSIMMLIYYSYMKDIKRVNNIQVNPIFLYLYDKLEITCVNRGTVKFGVKDILEYHKCNMTLINNAVSYLINNEQTIKKMLQTYILKSIEYKYDEMIREVTR